MEDQTSVSPLELGASVAEHQSQTAERFSEVNHKLDLIIDAVASLRAEFNNHWHPGPEAT